MSIKHEARQGLAVVATLLLSSLLGIALCQTPPSIEKPATPSEPFLGDPNLPRSATALLDVCISTDKYWSTYCQAYIDGTLHTFKTGLACNSSCPQDQSFCAGVEAATGRVQAFWKACGDCDFDEFRPDLEDEELRLQLIQKRMEQLRVEMMEELGECLPDEQHDEYYCKGYDAEIESSIASRFALYNASAGARDLGLENGGVDVFAHLFADQEIYSFSRA